VASLSSEWGGGVAPRPYEPQPADAPAAQFEGGTQFEQADLRIEHANTSLKSYVDRFAAQSERPTLADRDAAIRSFASTPAAADVDVAQEQFDQRVAEIEAEAAKIRNDLVQPGDAAEEMRRNRYWDNRVKPLLDREPSGHIASAAQQLLNDADPSQLGVLAELLPSYMKARGHGSEFVEPVVIKKLPELAAAQDKLAKAKQAQTIVRTKANMVRSAIRSGHPVSILPKPDGYDPDRQ
jgi:hypothetical protein